MRVEKRVRHEKIGSDGYSATEYFLTIGERVYRADHQLGSGVEIIAPSDPSADELAAVADYLMLQDGIRHVYFDGRALRPEPLREPRPLRADERQLLDHLLALDDPDVEPLRTQAQHVAVGEVAHLPFRLYLRVPDDLAPPADAVTWGPVIRADTIRDDDDIFSVSLWLDGGYLHSIDVDWYVNEPPRLPTPAELQPAERDRGGIHEL